MICPPEQLQKYITAIKWNYWHGFMIGVAAGITLAGIYIDIFR